MDERRIDSLIRMAAEIDEMERAAGAATGLRLVGASEGRAARRPTVIVRAMRIGAFAAAAACVALAVHFANQPAQTSPTPVPVAVNNGRGPSPSIHSEKLRPLDPADAVKTLAGKKLTAEQFNDWLHSFEHPKPTDVAAGVLAIFQDSEGVVRCVRWVPHNFGGRTLDKLRPGELVEATYGPHCSVIGPHRLIAVAVTGPKENLPDSDERAQALAQCIVGGNTIRCDADHSLSYTSSNPGTNAGCLPTGLQMMVETLAMGKP